MDTEALYATIRDAYEAQARLDARLDKTAGLSAETVLLGPGGLLDSMSVVAFLMELEDRLKKRFLDEVMAAAQKKRSFTVDDLVTIISK